MIPLPADDGGPPSVPPIDASAVVHTRSSSRRTPDPLTAGLFRTLTTPALNRRSLRWFGLPACTANPEDLPPSLAQHGSYRRPSTLPHSPFRTHRIGGSGATAPPRSQSPAVTCWPPPGGRKRTCTGRTVRRWISSLSWCGAGAGGRCGWTPSPLGGEHQPGRSPRHGRCVAIVRPTAEADAIPWPFPGQPAMLTGGAGC